MTQNALTREANKTPKKGHQKLSIADKSAEIETGPRCKNGKKEQELARVAILGYTNRPVTNTILSSYNMKNILVQAVLYRRATPGCLRTYNGQYLIKYVSSNTKQAT